MFKDNGSSTSIEGAGDLNIRAAAEKWPWYGVWYFLLSWFPDNSPGMGLVFPGFMLKLEFPPADTRELLI